MPGTLKQNIEISQGANFQGVMTCTQNDGSAFNLTGYIHRGTLKRSFYNIASLLMTSTTTDAVNGQVSLVLSAAQTSELIPGRGRYLYDVEIESASNNVIRVVEGMATIKPGTRHNG